MIFNSSHKTRAMHDLTDEPVIRRERNTLVSALTRARVSDNVDSTRITGINAYKHVEEGKGVWAKTLERRAKKENLGEKDE